MLDELERHGSITPRTVADYNGEGWPKSFKVHEELRHSLEARFGSPVPKLKGWLRKHFAGNTWMQQLSVREADTLCLHSFAARHGTGPDFETSSFCWDPCWSVGYAQKKHTDEQHRMPCQLRCHRPWYQHIRRYMLGLEMLYAHGFSRSFNWRLKCPLVASEDAVLAQRLVIPMLRGGGDTTDKAKAVKKSDK